MNLAPIILFVYNRPWHTQQTIEALQQNELATQSELFIYADGPKTEHDTKVKEVRDYIKTIKGFKNVSIIKRDKNWGLADNIIDGVTNIVNQFGRIIVLEDDLVTAKGFLRYMNTALDMYYKDEQVGGISGFQIKSDISLPKTSFLYKPTSWGWAVYKETWNKITFDAKEQLQKILNNNPSKFNFKHINIYSKMLEDKINGKNNSWAICFYASIFLENKLFLYPSKSFVMNIGFDEFATNTKSPIQDHFFQQKNELHQYSKAERIEIKESKRLRSVWEYYLNKNKFENKKSKLNIVGFFKNYIKDKIKIIVKNAIKDYNTEELNSKLKELEKGINTQIRKNAKIKNRQSDSKKILLGKSTIIDGELMIMGYGGSIKIGDYCYVGEGSRIWSGSSIKIGNNVLISHNVNIIDTNSHQISYLERASAFKNLLDTGYALKNKNIVCKPIVIEDYVWINFNATILKGVKIGKGAIIGPNSVVIDDVEPFCFYAGNPSKFIKKINQT